MVKMIISDVDGVIVGHKKGINFPYPSKKVISALKKVRQSGIPVVLCSGKSLNPIKPIISKAGLQNLHITDAGAIIFDPETEQSFAFSIENSVSKKLTKNFLKNDLLTEIYTENAYFLQKNHVNNLTSKRILIQQRDPVIVESLMDCIYGKTIIKIIALAKNQQEVGKIEGIVKLFKEKINFIWTLHPSTGSLQYGLVTSKTASKAIAAKEVSKRLGIPLEDTLGIGDTPGDWEFMKLCGVVAAMEDGSEELKKLVESKGKGKYIIAPSVNKDGILKALEFFELKS